MAKHETIVKSGNLEVHVKGNKIVICGKKANYKKTKLVIVEDKDEFVVNIPAILDDRTKKAGSVMKECGNSQDIENRNRKIRKALKHPFIKTV